MTRAYPNLLGKIATISACAAGCASPAASAAEWVAEAAVDGGLAYHDNLELQPEPEPSRGVELDMGARLSRRTESSDLALTPRLRSRRYVDRSELNADDPSLLASFVHTGERYSWNATARALRDTTLTSELVGTGLIDARKRHELLAAGAGVSRSLTERDGVDLQVGHESHSYQDAEFTGLVDYRFTYGTLSYQHLLGERTRIGTRLASGWQETPSLDTSSRGDSASLTFSRELGTQTRLDLSAGLERTSVDGRADDGEVFSLALDRRTEVDELHLSAARTVRPSGRGIPVILDELTLSWNRRLAVRVKSVVALHGIRDSAVGAQQGEGERRYGRAEARLEWLAAENLTLSLGANYAQQSFESGSNRGEGAGASLAFRWIPGRLALSR